MLRFIRLLFFVGLIAAGAAFLALTAPYKGFQNEVILEFPKGTSTRAMGDQLARAGVIRYSWQMLAARALKPSAHLQAGEYRFAKEASTIEVFNRIARGDVFYYEVTVPEGSNRFDIATLVEPLGIIRAKDFLKASANPAMIRDLDPRAETLEGYLFPSTYRLTRSTTAEQLCKKMTDEFRREWKAAGKGSSHETVTMASLIEKETGIDADRPLVASVYFNRLRSGMKLDCDPTTIYAALLDGRYRGVIHQSDLASRNPYNTYQHAGLPPGPIANPGIASIKAALAPAQSDYFYFVAKPGGGGAHNFAADLAAHERNVKEYRRGVKAAR